MKYTNSQKLLTVIENGKKPRSDSVWALFRNRQRLNTRLRVAKERVFNIPAVRLFVRTVEGAGSHDTGQRAAGVAYYAIISIFPLLLGLIAVFGFFLPSINLQDAILKFVGNNIPGATSVLKDNIAGIIRLRGVMSILSIIVLFWGASALFSATSLAINRAWDINKSRSFFIRKASELGMVLGTGILFLLSLGASAIVTLMREVLKMSSSDISAVYLSGRIIAFVLMFAVFLLLYKFVPNTKTYWRNVWPGALLATALFELARTLFLFYLQKFANYQLIYGSITSIIILLIWIYYSAFILILGAEFTFQYSRVRYSVTTDSSTVK